MESESGIRMHDAKNSLKNPESESAIAISAENMEMRFSQPIIKR